MKDLTLGTLIAVFEEMFGRDALLEHGRRRPSSSPWPISTS